MLLENIRSIGQLLRKVDTKTCRVCIYRQYGAPHFSIIFAYKVSNVELILYNSITNNIRRHSTTREVQRLIDKYGCPGIYRYLTSDAESEHAMMMTRIMGEFYLTPSDFIEKYESDIASKPFSEPISQSHLSSDNPNVMFSYAISGGSRHIFQWAINAWARHGFDLGVIRRMVMWTESYPQLSKMLKGGSITSYGTMKALFKLSVEQNSLRKTKRVNDAINFFNTTQKKVLRDNIKEGSSDYDAMSRFANLSIRKRLNIIKKVSSIDDYNEIITMIRHSTSTHYDWNKASLLAYIENVEGINTEIVFENDDTVLLKVFDFETVKKLGVTTNWCIGKNKSYWNQYLGSDNAVQYMVFDFSRNEDDKMSIIGITSIKNRGITSAHNFVNEDIIHSGDDDSSDLIVSNITSYLDGIESYSNVYSFLARKGIPLSLITSFDEASYEWSPDGVISYLAKCGLTHHYLRIIKNEDNKLVVSVKNSKIADFFGNSYAERIPSEMWGDEHVIFFNFSKSHEDNSSLVYSIIRDGGFNDDTPIGVFDKNSGNLGGGYIFEALLGMFGLPYDTIKRTVSKPKEIRNYFMCYNMEKIASVLRDSSLKGALIEALSMDDVRTTIINSILYHASPDFIDVIYGNGYTMTEILGESFVYDIICTILRSSCINNRGRKPMGLPTSKDIEDMHARRLTSKGAVMNTFYYTVLSRMLENAGKISKENVKRLIVGLINDSSMFMSQYSPLFNFFLEGLAEFADGGINQSQISTNAFRYLTNSVDNKVLEKLGIKLSFIKSHSITYDDYV